MACINNVKKGGNTIINNTVDIYKHIKKNKPIYLKNLRQNYYFERRGFNYANQVQALIEAHRIPEPVDAVWEWSEWTDCRNGKQSRTTKLISNARFGGRPYEPQKEEQECEKLLTKLLTTTVLL